MSVGRAKCVSSLPDCIGVPIVCTSFLPSRGELVDGMGAIINEPDVPLGIVGVDKGAVWPDEQLVVLFPRLDHLAVAIDEGDDVIPARMTRRILLRHVESGRVALPGPVPVAAAAATAAAFAFQHRQTAAGEDEHAIRALRPDPGRRSNLEAVTAVVLRPAGDEFIRAGRIVTAFFLGVCATVPMVARNASAAAAALSVLVTDLLLRPPAVSVRLSAFGVERSSSRFFVLRS